MKIGKFQVIGNLGMGANSSILHIRRSSDSRQYALKVVPIGGNEDLKFLTQARHEFRVSRMLDHRNLLSHTYDLTSFEKAVDAINERYLAALGQLHKFLQREVMK